MDQGVALSIGSALPARIPIGRVAHSAVLPLWFSTPRSYIVMAQLAWLTRQQ